MGLQKYVSCSGSAEDCAALATSLMSLESWLWKLMAESLSKLIETGSSDNDYPLICHYIVALLGSLYQEKCLISLLYVAHCCHYDQFSSEQLTSLTNQVEASLNHIVSGGNSLCTTNLADSIRNVVR